MSHSSGSTRMPTFSNLRRGVSRDRSEDSSQLQSHPPRSVQDLNNGVAIGKTSAPAKPPKPSAFRVKKAKALSISLLSGSLTASPSESQDQELNKSSSVDVASTSRWRTSRLFAPQSAALPNRLLTHQNDHSDSSRFRPQSAMDHYRSHGPSKGLASPGWRDHTKGKDSNVNEGCMHAASNAVSTLVRESEGPLSPSKSPQYQLRRIHSPSTTSFSDPQNRESKNDRTLQDYKRESQGNSRSQSSLGMHHSANGRFSSQSSLSTSVMEKLNSARDCDHMESVNGIEITQRYMVASSPLGNSHSATSAPVTPAYGRSDHSQCGSNGHSRTSSTISAGLPEFVSSLPLPKITSRNRAQSHAAISPTRLRAQLPAVPCSNDGQSTLAPPQHRYSKGSLQEGSGGGLKVQQSLPPRSNSPFGPASPLHVFGQQLGGIGAAVGKRGWDMMKSWNQGMSNQANGTSNYTATFPSSKSLSTNEATRIWNASPDPTSMIPTRSGVRRDDTRQAETGAIFGKSLRAAVIRTRLVGVSIVQKSEEISQLYALDLGSEFSINLPQLDLQEERRVGGKKLDRIDARNLYLPAIVVRCIEAIEKWGPSEEGIYRLSGRTSHTAKLKSIFDQQPSCGTPLQLADIGPADLDLNSVCSVLKAYLRALPETMLTSELSPLFNEAIKNACGQNLMGDTENLRQNEHFKVEEAKMQSSNISQRIANAIVPLMKKLPAVNWYLLREIAMHLGDLTREEIVQQTKMPLSNLCLVLAPTLSLSVVVVRTFVEERELIFGQSYPLADEDLDSVNSKGKPETSHRSDQESGMNDLPSIRQMRQLPDDWDMKRASIATVKALDSVDKRISTSSVATLQRGQQSSKSELRMTSNLSSYPIEKSKSSISPILQRSTSPEEIMEEVDAPPIAAHYIHIRKRSSSLANSMFSIHSNEYSPTNLSPQINKMSSSTSLYSIAAQGSTMDSSLPSSTDQDSPNTTDDDWPVNSSNTGNNDALKKMLDPSSSSTSVNSFSKRSALDRPRPITPHASHFFSR